MNLNAEQLAVLVRTLNQEDSDGCAEKRRAPRASHPGTLTITLCQPPLETPGAESDAPSDSLGTQHGSTELAEVSALSTRHLAAVRIANLSSRGIALIHSEPLEPGQRFMIQLPRQIDYHMHILCTVVHCAPSGQSIYNIGAEFTGVVPAEIPRRGRVVACA